MASGLWVLLRRELQDIFRSSRALGGLLAAAALAGTSAASLWPAERLAGPRAGATEDLVGIFLQLELLAGLILPSALLAANVATERARNTLDSLLAAPVSPATILCAKWLAAVAYLALVLLVMLPGLSGREILAGHALAGVYATSGLLLGMCVAVGCSICVRQLVIRDTFSASLATIGLGWLVLLSAHALGLGASLLAGVTCKTPTAALLRAALLSIVPFVLLVVPARLTGAPRTATGAFALMNFITAACWLGRANLLFTRKYARDP